MAKLTTLTGSPAPADPAAQLTPLPPEVARTVASDAPVNTTVPKAPAFVEQRIGRPATPVFGLTAEERLNRVNAQMLASLLSKLTNASATLAVAEKTLAEIQALPNAETVAQAEGVDLTKAAAFIAQLKTVLLG